MSNPKMAVKQMALKHSSSLQYSTAVSKAVSVMASAQTKTEDADSCFAPILGLIRAS